MVAPLYKLSVALVLGSIGCGSGPDVGTGASDASSEPPADAADDTADAFVPADAAVACSIDPLPDFGVHPGHDIFDGYNPPTSEWMVFYDVVTSDDNGDGQPDYLGGIYLRKGRGVFADGVEPGKYAITGADSSADSCAICVWAQSRTGTVQDDLYRFHGVSGTLYIDAIDEATEEITGRVLDVELVGYDIGYGGGDGCIPNDGSCGMTWCSGDNTCAAQVPRAELCGFSIGELAF